MDAQAAFFVKLGFLMAALIVLREIIFTIGRKRRRTYYRTQYLRSDDWQRKRALVLKRDGWRCVYCGQRATQVHHKKYARQRIGREPIDWLVSVCSACHQKQHH